MVKDNSNNKRCYDDIINLPHHISSTHLQMARIDRAAQFSPFAALTGYEDALGETGRLTETRMELDEDAKEILDEKLRMLQERVREHPKVVFTYFMPDSKKAGGVYVTTEGRVKKIDGYEQNVVMDDGLKIPIADITNIEGNIFSAL